MRCAAAAASASICAARRPPRPRAALVGARLLDQLLLAPGELDLVLQLVLLDGALLVDGERAPGEGGLVGLLLDLLARRRLAAPSRSRRRAARRRPGPTTIAMPIPPRLASAARPVADRGRAAAPTPSASSSRSVERARSRHGVLLRELGQAAARAGRAAARVHGRPRGRCRSRCGRRARPGSTTR